MLSYVQDFVIDHRMGYGYLFTNTMLIAAVIILFRNFALNRKGILAFIREWFVCLLIYVMMDSVYYTLFGNTQMDRVNNFLFIVLYCLLRSRYSWRVCLVRGSVLIASVMAMLPISEPLGNLVGSINKAWFGWSQYLTPLAMAAMFMLEVWFLRHFTFDARGVIGTKHVVMQVIVSAVAVAVIMYMELSGAARTVRGPNVLICASFWFIILLTYYQFYTIDQSAQKNLELNALKQKAELETEKYHATKLNYEELRSIRHEIKNHNFYLKALLDENNIDEAREYLDRVSSKGTRYLKSFDSGNYAVDVVMNHEMAAAREQKVTIDTKILVPKQLPFRDEDVCSLLSNLLDNAIEAAARSDLDQPVVQISILPRQEYLFIRITNPVDKTMPEKRRLTLKTTKTDHTEMHGFGTQIIRRIAETYNGSVKYSMSGGIFTTDVMLEMPGEGEKI